MPTTPDPALAFLRDHLLPLRERNGAAYDFTGPQPDVESYFTDCEAAPGGMVREAIEDVPAMLDDLVARWRAEGRDDLASLEEALHELADALLAEDEAKPKAPKVAGGPIA